MEINNKNNNLKDADLSAFAAVLPPKMGPSQTHPPFSQRKRQKVSRVRDLVKAGERDSVSPRQGPVPSFLQVFLGKLPPTSEEVRGNSASSRFLSRDFRGQSGLHVLRIYSSG